MASESMRGAEPLSAEKTRLGRGAEAFASLVPPAARFAAGPGRHPFPPQSPRRQS
jgi:hypothetical protein